MRKIALFLIIGIFFNLPAFADLSTYEIYPMKLPGSARTLGMGNAATGIRDLGNYNPGFLPWSKGITFFTKSIQGKTTSQSQLNFTASFPTGKGATSGLSLITDNLAGVSGSNLSSRSTLLVLSYGTRLHFKHDFDKSKDIKDWSAGVNLKVLLNETFNDGTSGEISGSGWDIDLGMAYMLSPWANLGLCAKNILPIDTFSGGTLNWNNDTKEGFPASINLGLGLLLAGKHDALIERRDDKFLLDLDLEYGNSYKQALFKIGSEYSRKDKYYYRLGLTQQGTSFGFGLRGIETWEMDLTLAYDAQQQGTLIVLSGSYFPQDQLFIKKPIEAISISKEASTYHRNIEVTGKVKPDIKEVIVNKKPVKIEKDFTFKYVVPLAPGDNAVKVESKYENESSAKSYSIERKLPPKEPVKEISITDLMTTTEAMINLSGRAEPEIPIKINKQSITTDKEGRFKSKINLKPGYNKIEIEGQYGEKKVKRTYTIEGQFGKRPVGQKYVPEPTRIRIIGQSTYEVGQASPMLKIVTEDDYGVRIPVLEDTKIYLISSSPTGVFSTTKADGPWNATYVIIPAGSTEAHCYYMDTEPGNPVLEVFEPKNDWEDSYYGEHIIIRYIEIEEVTPEYYGRKIPEKEEILAAPTEGIEERHKAKAKRLAEAGFALSSPAELRETEDLSVGEGIPKEMQAPVKAIEPSLAETKPWIAQPDIPIATTTTVRRSTTTTLAPVKAYRKPSYKRKKIPAKKTKKPACLPRHHTVRGLPVGTASKKEVVIKEKKIKMPPETRAAILFQQKQFQELPAYPIKSPLIEANKFERMQKLLKKKTGLTILRIAKIKLPPGYFMVFVVTGDRYLALKNLRNGLVRVDYYNSILYTWKKLSTIRLEEIIDLI